MIYIVLPVHNRILATSKFMACLIDQSMKDFRILLIDDGSTDGTSEMVIKSFPNSIILRGNGNLWWGGSLQVAYEWLRLFGVYNSQVLIVNDDTVFEHSFLEMGANLLKKKSGCAYLASCFDMEKPEVQVDRGIFIDWSQLEFKSPTDSEPANCFSTRGLFLNLKDFIKVGGFYPRLLPHYLSDYEFTVRAQKQGLKIKVSDDIQIWVDSNLTGFHSIKEKNIRNYFLKYLSKKNPMNPFYFLSFVVLCSPVKYKLKNIIQVVYRSIMSVGINFLK